MGWCIEQVDLGGILDGVAVEAEIVTIGWRNGDLGFLGRGDE